MEKTEQDILIKDNNNKKLTPTRIILIGFLVIILIGSFLLTLPISNSDGKWLSYIDSIFTSTSAVCVTGLVVRDTAVQFTTFGEIVILILIQVGGLGFMTVATLFFIIMGKKITLKDRLAIRESLVQLNLQGLVKLIKAILFMTLLFEGIGALLLMISFIPEFGVGRGIYYSIFHSISAFCNAGFDILGTSEAPYQGYSIFATRLLACLPLLLLIISGGLGFAVIREAIMKKNWLKLTIHSKVVLTITGILLVFSTLFYLVAEFTNPLTIGNMSIGNKLLNSLFQAVTPRTAGFSTIAQNDLTSASKLYTLFMMFIGASPGSTGGGVKITVIFVILVVVINNLKGRNKVVIDKQEIPQKQVMKAISIVLYGVGVILTISILVMLIEQGRDIMTFENILFETFSAFGTVGLTQGITPYLSTPSKVLYIITMFIGRVGPLTVGLAFAAKYNSNMNNNIKYSEAKIMVG